MQERLVLKAVERDDPGALFALVRAEPRLRQARGPDGVSALLHALYRRRMHLVELLRHDQLDGFEAAALGDVERLMSLLFRDDMVPLLVNGDGYTALHLAAFFNQPGTARLLIATGADIDARAENETRQRPLHAAVVAGSVGIVTQLLYMGAYPDLQQKGGWTPLHLAAAYNRIEIAELLLQHDASIDIRDEAGDTPVDLAARRGHAELLARLIAER